MRAALLAPRFIESIPETLDGGVLYVSITFATAMHLCACGCGSEVVTPLSPTDWKLCFDGEHVTLDPSIGNWSFPCRSHYWVRKNQIRWAASMSEKQISDGRAFDRTRKTSLAMEAQALDQVTPAPATQMAKPDVQVRRSCLDSIWSWLSHRKSKKE